MMEITVIYDEIGSWFLSVNDGEREISENMSLFYGEISGVETVKVDSVENIENNLVKERVKNLLKKS
jgi:hypothetical protein